MTFDADLRLSLRRSGWFAWLLGAAHGGAGLLCWLVPIEWWLALGLSTGAAVSFVISLRRHALRIGGTAIIGIELTAAGAVTVQDGAGHWSPVEVGNSSFVSPALAVLNLHAPGARWTRSLVIPAGSLPAEEFRRLRVWLRWRPLGPGEERAE